MFDTTKHAAAVIVARGVKDDWIIQMLQHPEKTHPDAEDAELTVP